ncbi:MAG: Ig domain-containing protein, partial [Candidatus Acidiferrales bacterium]
MIPRPSRSSAFSAFLCALCGKLFLLASLPLCIPASLLAQQADDADLRIETPSLPDPIARRSYFRRLDARGGKPPYRWSLAVPYLPVGLRLDETTGALIGVPTDVDQSDFTLEVTDSSSPPQSARRSFVLNVVERLVVRPGALPRATRAARYRATIGADGGTQPFFWEVAGGSLPPGVLLDPVSGALVGAPAEAGEFRFTARVNDSGSPPQLAEETFTINVVAPLEITWAEPPRVRDSGIFGSVRVSNGTRDDLDLTVIVVAVNEYNKAFALGYHHFTIKSGEETRDLLFGFSLPKGTYTVHADAVAEFAPGRAIYRTRLQ